MTNQIKTWVYLTALTILVMYLGQLLGGRQGLLAGFLVAMGVNFFSYFYSDKLLLKTYGAQLIEGVDPYGLQNMVTSLALKTGIPKPQVYIIPSETPNAFATGRSPRHASVAATEGLLRILNKEELEGVLAHELSHVEHRDTLIMTIAATLAAVIMYISNVFKWTALWGMNRDDDRGNVASGFLLAFVAPVAALLIQLAVSRSREYLADAHGAEVTSNPQALASALWKIHNYSQSVPLGATPATAHMFIINPLYGGGFSSLFSTHPPINDRIKRLIGRTL